MYVKEGEQNHETNQGSIVLLCHTAKVLAVLKVKCEIH